MKYLVICKVSDFAPFVKKQLKSKLKRNPEALRNEFGAIIHKIHGVDYILMPLQTIENMYDIELNWSSDQMLDGFNRIREQTGIFPVIELSE